MNTENIQLTPVAQANALALANAAEVGVGVIASIAGNEIANTLHGESMSRDRLTLLFLTQLNEEIQKN